MKTKRTRKATAPATLTLRSATAELLSLPPAAPGRPPEPGQPTGPIAAADVATGPDRVRLLEAEISTAVDFPEVDYDLDALVSAFIDTDGSLRTTMKTVPRLAEAATGGLATLDRNEGIERLRAAAFAKSTLAAYGNAVSAWQAWCRRERRAPLPLDPAGVTAHLLETAFKRDEQGRYLVGPSGALVPQCSLATVSLRLAGLNKLATFLRVPRPGDNLGIKEIMRGIRRCLGVQTERRAPIDLDNLDRCCAAADGSTFVQARTRALLLARVRTGSTAGQLAKVSWTDIELGEDDVTVTLPPDHSSQQRRTVVVPRHPNPSLCLLTALTDLRRAAPQLAAVFSSASGSALDRATIYRNLIKLGRGRSWAALATVKDHVLAGLLVAPNLRTRLETAHTRAVLLVGFWTAARRSNLAALNWRDVTDLGDDGWRVIWRRSKTDQEGKGFTIYLPKYDDPANQTQCPSHALEELRAAQTEALGRPPHPSDPVFWTLTPGGNPKLTLREARPTRTSGKSINLLVQRVAIDAGLTEKPRKGQKNPYGGHSLRMGFVTEALRDDKLTVGEVADVTGHASYDVLMRYRNEINAAKHAPGRKLAQKLNRGS